MTERSQRRAAERKARKAELKKLRNLQSETPSADIPEPTPIRAQPTQTSSISEAQLAANRANAQQSTGPKTESGKSISAQNNFRHGLTQTEDSLVLLESESPAKFAQALANYQSEWKPQSETEHALVNRLATHEWLRQRALGLQRNFQDASGLILDVQQFNLYRRYEVQHERGFNKALSDLLRLKSLRQREQNGFESQARKNEKHEYQIRHLQHREKMQWFKEMTAQARLTLQESKLAPPVQELHVAAVL